MTLPLYFARRFMWIFAGLTLVFFLLLFLIDMMEELRRFDVEELGLSQVVQVTLLKTPEGLYEILPLLVILSTVTLFIGLARTNELVVVRAAGRSALVTLLAPVTAAFLIGLVGISTVNPIVAATTERYEVLSDRFRSGGASAFSLSREGLWLRQGDASGQTVIHAEQANEDATLLYDVTFVAYAPGGGPTRRIEAARARLTDKAWLLRDAKEWPLVAGTNPEQHSKRHERLVLPSTLTPDTIRDSFGRPNTISIWELPEFVAQLEEAGFSARRHKVWIQMELAMPVFLVAMVLVSAAFTMRHARAGRTGLAVLLAVMMGFALYYVRNFAQILGENGQIPVALAAWAPPVASVMLALGLLLHMEEG
ncbi:lipopolysaccharide export system permease protein [Salinihabitans flavidus]|uniref:Lipopolysaccharide export system permease protein n=1 Tax=Salinihabitans flavidus TaxID=569882 RepID=A0A1H8RQS8_9RHOB|nr:LPS export ABC transporter permease LptG [Salinihabitans flavidus]SEO68313.1 lipopolysaccharide export system permease protein [Salinihabitans flavidus]